MGDAIAASRGRLKVCSEGDRSAAVRQESGHARQHLYLRTADTARPRMATSDRCAGAIVARCSGESPVSRVRLYQGKDAGDARAAIALVRFADTTMQAHRAGCQPPTAAM